MVSDPVPDLVRSAPDTPAITDAAVKVLPEATVKVASFVPSVIPRFAAMVSVSETDKVPPLMETAVAVTETGTAPRFRSDEIDTVPPVIDVAPSYVFVADSVNVPAADFAT